MFLVPALLILHRAVVVQRRMPPSVIVGAHPVLHHLPGLFAYGEFLFVNTRRFLPAPEAFRRRGVPTVALPAHG